MKKIIAFLSFFAPVFAFAQNTSTNVQAVLVQIQGVLNIVIPVLITIGIIYFIWNVVTYMLSGDAEKREESRDHIIYSLIGLFVILAVWGLVSIIANTLGVDTSGQLQGGQGLPCIENLNVVPPVTCNP